jgi:Protein of unknown function (DUF2946)
VRLRRSRCSGWAAWLGVLALAVNALVPIHVAFDLAEAFGPAPSLDAHAAAHGAAWRMLAVLIGHQDGDDKPDGHGKDHHESCPVCSALGALAGFAPVAPVALPLPPLAAMPAAAPAIVGRPADAAPLAYRSRAPPIA